MKNTISVFSQDSTPIDTWFSWQYAGKWHFGELVELEDYDKHEYKDLPLKEGQRLIRYKTENMLGRMVPLIKINIEKGLIYFLKESEIENDSPVFETRGIKAKINFA
jgi:hypothetical protein